MTIASNASKPTMTPETMSRQENLQPSAPYSTTEIDWNKRIVIEPLQLGGALVTFDFTATHPNKSGCKAFTTLDEAIGFLHRNYPRSNNAVLIPTGAKLDELNKPGGIGRITDPGYRPGGYSSTAYGDQFDPGPASFDVIEGPPLDDVGSGR